MAMVEKKHTLSEFNSKRLVAQYGVPVSREKVAPDIQGAAEAANDIGFPIALKICGDSIQHKTDRGLVCLGLSTELEVKTAAGELLKKVRPEDGDVNFLISEMVEGQRELIAGIIRDPTFGPCVVLGVGGILTEAIGDVAFGTIPLETSRALSLVDELVSRELFTKQFRGEPGVDRNALASVLLGLSRLASERTDIASVDLNPIILSGKCPIVADAMVEFSDRNVPMVAKDVRSNLDALDRLRPLFHPRGIVIAGVSSHPGKFGFVAYHNLRRFGYDGRLYPLTRDGRDLLGQPTFADIREIPRGSADLVFVCTPNHVNVELLKSCSERGVKAAFVASGGYAESGEEGRVREKELANVANELNMVLAGPNGQGVISTSQSMCAQIVPPFPPPGHISIASQSGNLVSSFLNYAVLTGIGVSKAISAGNSVQLSLSDYLDYYSVDSETEVVLAYLEGIRDGAHFLASAKNLSQRKPLVLLKGGAFTQGQQAALSHTGSLATDDRVFSSICRQLGICRAADVEQAYEWAATFATQPLPRGRRTVVFTTAGGWGVLAADACAKAGLDLIPLPDSLRDQIDQLVDPRWSRQNPIDLAGSETRDTIPKVLDLICSHDKVDGVIHLGLGIQAAQGYAFSSGPFNSDKGISRIVDFHRSQDVRYAEAARKASIDSGKPVLSATELVHTDRHYGNSGTLSVKAGGRLCYPSAQRAIYSLRALCDYSEYRRSAN